MCAHIYDSIYMYVCACRDVCTYIVYTCIYMYIYKCTCTYLPWTNAHTVSSPSPMGVEGGEKKGGLVQLDPKEKMSYTEQAAKRQHCQRLTRYIYTCIYSHTTTTLIRTHIHTYILCTQSILCILTVSIYMYIHVHVHVHHHPQKCRG